MRVPQLPFIMKLLLTSYTGKKCTIESDDVVAVTAEMTRTETRDSGLILIAMALPGECESAVFMRDGTMAFIKEDAEAVHDLCNGLDPGWIVNDNVENHGVD